MSTKTTPPATDEQIIPTAAAPGSADFDVDGATGEDYAKHVEILRRRAEVAGLTPSPLAVTAQETTAAPVPTEPAPISGDIMATHADLGERGFTEKQWKELKDEKGYRQGWKKKAEKPAELN